jgi:hypothetical protein
MTRAPAIVLACLVVLGCSTGSAVGRSTPSSKPSLQLVRTAPMTVRGRGFRAGERVSLTLGAGRRATARADRRGSFVASFEAGSSRCERVRVVAVGSHGSRAVLKMLPAPACMPARAP